MVVKMMKWRPWPPFSYRKFEIKIGIRHLQGLEESQRGDVPILTVEVKWKGPKSNGLSSLRRRVRKNLTRAESTSDNGVVEWNEDFQSVCTFSMNKEGSFHPWEVAFTVFDRSNQGPKSKVPFLATASLNLAELASSSERTEVEISVPLTIPGGITDCSPSLCLSLRLLELYTTSQEPVEKVQRPRLSKVKIFKGFSAGSDKKVCREEEGSDERISVRSEDVEYNYPFDTDSLDDDDDDATDDESSGLDGSRVRKSFSYGSLAYANNAGGLVHANKSSIDEDWIYYSDHNQRTMCSYENSDDLAVDQSLRQSSKRGILHWRKRKLSFRSPKEKGQPLLRKGYAEDGGDDIDFVRRMLSSSDESTLKQLKSEEDPTQCLISEFGDDLFAVGSWEQKEVISRDGQMKLQTEVFFASIDQRSERASGESACTALVAVIADWFQSNPNEMPIKCQLDTLIREGSTEWRNLCENESYRERFPDKHFDLETVLRSEVRPLTVVPEKSFVGFFQPKDDGGGFDDFLGGAMSFDSIWDNEISRPVVDGDQLIYIVSWNDHFFVLKIENDAYYIVDTLGERLQECCDQAYILKFDENTMIQRLPDEPQSSSSSMVENPNADNSGEKVEEESFVCKGKESCKEYIKSFLAAIPIRELQADIKMGLMGSTTLHQRLQIEFHYTRPL